MPTASVIIPTYNRADLLPRAIKSVLNQTFQDFELIIVDDASTDNTEEVVKSFHDRRIIYIKHERNKGVCASRNTGIKKSQGQYIAFLDHDDEYLPYHIERKINILQKIDRSYGFIYSDCFLKSSKGTVYFSIEEAQKHNGIILMRIRNWSKRYCFGRIYITPTKRRLIIEKRILDFNCFSHIFMMLLTNHKGR